MNFREWQRPVLLVAMAVVGVLLLIQWQKFQEERHPEVETSTTTTTTTTAANDAAPPPTDTPEAPSASQVTDTQNAASATNSSDVPTPVDNSVPNVNANNNVQAPAAKLISVTTDTLEVLIDPYGGDIVKVALPKQSVSIDRPDDPLILLNRTENTIFVAQSGLIGRNGTDLSNGQRPLFTTSNTDYRLGNNQDELQVDLKYQQGEVAITKRFIFKRDDNYIAIDYLIDNQSSEPWVANFYGQIKRDDHKAPKSGPAFGIRSFEGMATTSKDAHYKKYTFKQLNDGDFAEDFGKGFENDGGWIAMVQHYFVSAWVPPQDEPNNYFVRKLVANDQYLFGYTGPAERVAPGQQGTIQSGFYSGPKDIHRLEALAPDLDRVLDFSWLFFIARPMYLFLLWIHNFVFNWGLAIIVLVLCIKTLFFPIASAGFKSMAKMKVFAPKMQELKERYGDNKQKLSEEMMKLYKKEGVNPVGGCLPMVLQIPVFISLYWVILEAVDLRHAPFFLWINDLSDQDPFFILPILYAGIMFLQQKLNPSMGDPTQQKIMQMMPIVFGIMFLWFPAGLVLYWVVNQLLSILQQWYITRQIEKAQGAKKA